MGRVKQLAASASEDESQAKRAGKLPSHRVWPDCPERIDGTNCIGNAEKAEDQSRLGFGSLEMGFSSIDASPARAARASGDLDLL